ncbi:hypothetical protein [Methylovulum psychrotolerans]|uniref:hypothetical protein n=1 Tax=Methylovulum psychrotolerans TaxID=1704499 RepID=UPI0012FC5630|nr:hypothetical protein [Methylovulum psychrotolerans]
MADKNKNESTSSTGKNPTQPIFDPGIKPSLEEYRDRDRGIQVRNTMPQIPNPNRGNDKEEK